MPDNEHKPSNHNTPVDPPYIEGHSDIEFIDIPLDELPSVPPALITLASHFTPRSPVWRWTTIGGIILFVLLVLFGTLPNSLFTAPVTAIPTPHQIPLLLNANPLQPIILAPAPQNCPSLAPLHTFDPATFSPGVGASPVWVTGFSGPFARLVHLDDS